MAGCPSSGWSHIHEYMGSINCTQGVKKKKRRGKRGQGRHKVVGGKCVKVAGGVGGGE